MAEKEIVIALSNPASHVYYPGDTVSGTVHTNFSPETDLKQGIDITLYGAANVAWSEGHGGNVSSYNFTDPLFIRSIHQGASIEQTTYPFSIELPVKVAGPWSEVPSILPWSATTANGSIEYGVKARVKKPLGLIFAGNAGPDIEGNTKLILNSHSGPEITPESSSYFKSVRTCSSQEATVGYGCLPCFGWRFGLASDKIWISIAHQTPRVLPGDVLPFTVKVVNSSTCERLGNAKIQLVGNWDHIAFDRTKTIETVYHEQILTINLPPGEKTTLSGNFNIPLGVMPTQLQCRLLKLTYKLRVICHEMSGCLCNGISPTVEADLVIGTKE